MAKLWVLDICPPGDACIVEQGEDWNGLRQVVRYCPLHLSVKNNRGLSDDDVFAVIRKSCAVKETARYAAKTHLGLSEDHPGLPYRVEPSGDITVGVLRDGSACSEWPDRQAQYDALASAINIEVGKLSRPAGTATLIIGPRRTA